MDDKQQNQKTVVAFIAGLIIGGLLVWIFSAVGGTRTPSDANSTKQQDSQEETANTDTATNTGVNQNTIETSNEEAPAPALSPTTGAGALTVENQKAGNTVAIRSVTYAGTDGWIVVHEMSGDNLGKALGASRYATKVGLTPKTVELLRNTAAGQKYSVMFYSENGDRLLDFATDKPILGSDNKPIGTTFTVE